MKKLFALIGLFSLMACLPPCGHATWVGSLDLTPSISPIVLRDVHDGQWLAGITKPNLWHLDYHSVDGGSIWDGQRVHAGVFQAWNAEHGNASFGPLLGFDVPLPVATTLGVIGGALGLQQIFKPAQYLSSMLTIDGFAGYRPVHTADVDGNYIYGAAAALRIAFGVHELQQGL